jgi:hypothetical protein
MPGDSLFPVTDATKDAILGRFYENLLPRGLRPGERCPGAVIARLDGAGCPAETVIVFLFRYAFGSQKLRERMRRRKRRFYKSVRLQAELALITLEDWQEGFPADLTGDDLAKRLQECNEVKRAIQLGMDYLKRHRYSGRTLRHLGAAPLEYLAMIQVYGEAVGSPISDVELSELVWAAVSAVHPKAKRIETDTLAQAMRRFHKRNPWFKGELRTRLWERAARQQKQVPSERLLDEDLRA